MWFIPRKIDFYSCFGVLCAVVTLQHNLQGQGIPFFGAITIKKQAVNFFFSGLSVVMKLVPFEK